LLDHLGPCTIVLADKAYDADRIRELIQDQGATPTSRASATTLETVIQPAPLA